MLIRIGSKEHLYFVYTALCRRGRRPRLTRIHRQRQRTRVILQAHGAFGVDGRFSQLGNLPRSETTDYENPPTHFDEGRMKRPISDLFAVQTTAESEERNT